MTFPEQSVENETPFQVIQGGAHEVGRISDAVVVQVEASSTECHVQSKPPLINMRGFTGEKVPQWRE